MSYGVPELYLAVAVPAAVCTQHVVLRKPAPFPPSLFFFMISSYELNVHVNVGRTQYTEHCCLSVSTICRACCKTK